VPIVPGTTAAHDAPEQAQPVTVRKPPAKVIREPPRFAAAYADLLPESHREALRDDAAIVHVDECLSPVADGEPGQSFADVRSAPTYMADWFGRRATKT
jgi:hypothetical protein